MMTAFSTETYRDEIHASSNKVTGYTRLIDGRLTLTDWNGEPLFVQGEGQVVQEYRDQSCAIVFPLPFQRFLVGYALGDNDMLFRGEIVEDMGFSEASRAAIAESEYWSALDCDHDELSFPNHPD